MSLMASVPTISFLLLARATVSPGFEGGRQRFVDGKGDRDRPGEFLAVAIDDFLVEHAVESGLVHGADERAETAVAEAIKAGQVGVADWNPFEGGRLLKKIRRIGGGTWRLIGSGKTP